MLYLLWAYVKAMLAICETVSVERPPTLYHLYRTYRTPHIWIVIDLEDNRRLLEPYF